MIGLSLYVWEDVLEDYSTGIAFAFACNEAEAWELLKEKDRTAWWVLRGEPEDRNDPREPHELPEHLRPMRKITPSAYACHGGG